MLTVEYTNKLYNISATFPCQWREGEGNVTHAYVKAFTQAIISFSKCQFKSAKPGLRKPELRSDLLYVLAEERTFQTNKTQNNKI